MIAILSDVKGTLLLAALLAAPASAAVPDYALDTLAYLKRQIRDGKAREIAHVRSPAGAAENAARSVAAAEIGKRLKAFVNPEGLHLHPRSTLEVVDKRGLLVAGYRYRYLVSQNPDMLAMFLSRWEMIDVYVDPDGILLEIERVFK